VRTILVLLALLFSTTVQAADWSIVLKGSEHSIPRLEILTKSDDSGICSAVVINATAGFALTAAHCVNDEKDTVTLNGRHAKFVKANKILDLAVLRFDTHHERALPLAPEAPEVGSAAAILGYPFGSETFHVQTGVVSAPYDRECKCLKLNVDVALVTRAGPSLMAKAG
jgi:S1-C subfamily serine protease